MHNQYRQCVHGDIICGGFRFVLVDLGVNRMALKYHVGVKIGGVIQSVGATDSELAAHVLLDLVSGIKRDEVAHCTRCIQEH